MTLLRETQEFLASIEFEPPEVQVRATELINALESARRQAAHEESQKRESEAAVESRSEQRVKTRRKRGKRGPASERGGKATQAETLKGPEAYQFSKGLTLGSEASNLPMGAQIYKRLPI